MNVVLMPKGGSSVSTVETDGLLSVERTVVDGRIVISMPRIKSGTCAWCHCREPSWHRTKCLQGQPNCKWGTCVKVCIS